MTALTNISTKAAVWIQEEQRDSRCSLYSATDHGKGIRAAGITAFKLCGLQGYI